MSSATLSHRGTTGRDRRTRVSSASESGRCSPWLRGVRSILVERRLGRCGTQGDGGHGLAGQAGSRPAQVILCDPFETAAVSSARLVRDGGRAEVTGGAVRGDRRDPRGGHRRATDPDENLHRGWPRIRPSDERPGTQTATRVVAGPADVGSTTSLPHDRALRGEGVGAGSPRSLVGCAAGCAVVSGCCRQGG
jgi:hypothetical protein